MKREHSSPNPNHQIRHHVAAAAVKSPKIWPEDCCDGDGGMDELLAMLGYKVRESDMADVAQRLTQLEEAMCSVQNDNLSLLASDSVHYNPSELSTWLDTMLADLNPPPCFDAFISSSSAAAESSTVTTVFDQDSSSSDYELKAISGKAVIYNDNNSSSSSSRESKRMKPYTAAASASAPPPPPPPPPPQQQQQQIVLVDSQENGIRLVHALMACGEAIQSNNLPIAEALVKQINVLAASQAGAMKKVATYFYQALVRRIYALSPENSAADYSLSDFLHMQFYETCPYLKFAHFTANQAILEAFQGKSRVHVIDFSMNQGMQWPALMQALALRPGGPPSFRLTGIGPPAHDNADYLQEVGWKLAQLADQIHVEFEYRGFVANSLADLDSAMLELRPSESVAVNSVFELHKLLARTGAIEKVLSVVKRMRPEILTVVEQEANHNGPVFLDRFTEALHYYSTMFDSLEGSSSSSSSSSSPPPSSAAMMAEVYLGKQIANVVACEGVDRVERHETMEQWKDRFESAGFGPAHLGSNAFKQASMLLALYAGGDGYVVEERNGCLTLGWHSRQLIATSAWKLNEPVRVGSDLPMRV